MLPGWPLREVGLAPGCRERGCGSHPGDPSGLDRAGGTHPRDLAERRMGVRRGRGTCGGTESLLPPSRKVLGKRPHEARFETACSGKGFFLSLPAISMHPPAHVSRRPSCPFYSEGHWGLQRRVSAHNLQTPSGTLPSDKTLSSCPVPPGQQSGLRGGWKLTLCLCPSVPTLLCGAAVCLGEDGLKQ